MKKNIIIILLITLLFAVAILVVNRNIIKPDSDNSLLTESGNGTESGEIKEIDRNSILIAAISAKTGTASESNKYMYIALRNAVNELNSKGGILNKKVEILELDNQSTSLGSKKAAEDAVRADVTAVIGALRSSHSLAAAPILQKAGIPMISPLSTNPKVTEIGDYIFRVCYIDSFQGDVLANFALKDLQAKTAATITNTNRIFSIELSDIFKKSFTSGGGQFLYNGDYLDSESDYKKILTDIKKVEPDVIMIPSNVRDSGFIIKQARKMNIESIMIGPDSWSEQLFQFADNYAENCYFSTHWHKDLNTNENRFFVDKYMKLDESAIRVVIPLTYDSLAVLANSIEKANSLDKKEIRDQLAATRNFKGITGNITFNKVGNPVRKSAVILKLINNSTEFYKTVEVYEEE